MKILGGIWNSAVALQPCPSGRITADKRQNFILPQLPSANSFIRKMLYDITKLGGVYYDYKKFISVISISRDFLYLFSVVLFKEQTR